MVTQWFRPGILRFLSRPLLLTRRAPLLLWPGTLAADAVARDTVARDTVARDAVVSVVVSVAGAVAAAGPRGPRGQGHGVTATLEDSWQILQGTRVISIKYGVYVVSQLFPKPLSLQTILRF